MNLYFKLKRANSEIEKLRKSTSIELQTIKAELRKAEIKISSLELSVQQKVILALILIISFSNFSIKNISRTKKTLN